MTTPSPKNIPLNKEHVEARQAEVDAIREEAKKAMSEEECARLDVIERASAMLKDAGVEFYLAAVGATKIGGVTPRNWSFFWFKNEDDKTFFEDGRKFGYQVMNQSLYDCEKFMSCGLTLTVHGWEESRHVFGGPVFDMILKARRDRENGLTPPPDSL